MARRTRSGRLCLRQLDASTAASGPHDFAVRDPSSPRGFAGLCTSGETLVKTEAAPFVCAPQIAHEVQPALRLPMRARRCRVHRIPSRVRDDRDTPLMWDETARLIEVIWVK